MICLHFSIIASPSGNLDNFTTLVPHLIYFRIKLAQISFEIAQNILFLRLPSELRELSLSTWSIEYANGNSWENLLSSKFPHLKHFRLIISLDEIPSNYPIESNTDLDNIVQSFNQSKYFLDHHWNVFVNIHERDRLKFVLHTVPYPIENFQTTLYNIRRCTLSPSKIKLAYQYVSKLSLTLHNDSVSLLCHHEYRYLPNVKQLILLSNLTNDGQQFESMKYFNHLKNLINLSNVTLLEFPEESHQYPIHLVDLFLTNFSKLTCLTISHRLYAHLQTRLISSLRSLTLIFAVYYSSVRSSTTRMQPFLTSNRILTNDLILELVQTLPTSSPDIQTLMLIVRDFHGFDNQFSELLKTKILNERNISYDLLMHDKTVRFSF